MKWAANADPFELKYEDMFTTVLPGIPLMIFLVWMGYAYQWKSSGIEQPEWITENFGYSLIEDIKQNLDFVIDTWDDPTKLGD